MQNIHMHSLHHLKLELEEDLLSFPYHDVY